MKRIELLALSLLLAAALAGCSLALPQEEAQREDDIVGFWAIYDRYENRAGHELDIGDQNEQFLLLLPSELGEDNYRDLRVTGSFGDASTHINVTDAGVEYTISGTLYLVRDENRNPYESFDQEIWLYDDVVASFRDYLDPSAWAEGGAAPAAEIFVPGTMVAYLPQDQIDLYGEELMRLAKEMGVDLTLRTESPRMLTVYSVYRRADGTLYAPDMGTSFDGGFLDGFGHSMSTSRSQTVNGVVTEETSVSISLTVKTVKQLSSVRVIEMSAAHEAIRERALTEEEIRRMMEAEESYLPAAECAYVIVEELHADGSAARSLYSRPAANDLHAPVLHTLRYPREDMLTEAAHLAIDFGEPADADA